MEVLMFWLNAFIPRDVPGYTKLLSAGPHSGKTAIPLPGIARTWPGNTLKAWNAGFLTDQRSFDNDPAASVRMRSLLVVDASSLTFMRELHQSSGTTEVDLVSGKHIGFAVADMSRCSFNVSVSTPTGLLGGTFGGGRGPNAKFPQSPATGLGPPRVGSLAFKLNAAAGDPLVGMAADIDYEGAITITRAAVGGPIKVAFEGKIDAFPAYECYASLNNVTKELFRSAPPVGNTVANLLGPANRPISGSVTFP